MSGHINLLIVSLEFNFNNIMEAVKSAEGREYTIADHSRLRSGIGEGTADLWNCFVSFTN